MKFPFFRLTRREAFVSAAGAVTTSANPDRTLPAALVTLKKHDDKDLLLKMAMTRDRVFAIWSTSLGLRGSSRLACYTLDGIEEWSTALPGGYERPVIALIASSDTEAALVFINRADSVVTFSKYDSRGSMNQEDNLPLSEGVLAVAAGAAGICELDMATNVISKKFGGMEAARQTSPAFDTPSVGGLRPKAIVASAHFLGDQLVLLDHMKARVVTMLSSGEWRTGRLIHPRIDEAIQKQDSDVQSRLALVRPSGNEGAVTFPLCISLAASDRINSLWVASSIGTGLISLLRFGSAMEFSGSVKIEIPAGSLVSHRPPLMLAVSSAKLALGFREGIVALADSKE